MNKEEFLSKLKKGIKDMPEDDKKEALVYYEEYFEDAEDEQKAVEELGNPSKIAMQLMGEYAIKNIEEKGKNKKETKIEDEEIKTNNNSMAKNIILIMLAILAAPIAAPLAIALFGVLFAILVAICAVSFALVCAFLAVIIAGIALMVNGFLTLFAIPGLSLLMIGAGIVILAIAIILIGLIIVILKLLLKGIVKIVKRIVVRRDK